VGEQPVFALWGYEADAADAEGPVDLYKEGAISPAVAKPIEAPPPPPPPIEERTRVSWIPWLLPAGLLLALPLCIALHSCAPSRPLIDEGEARAFEDARRRRDSLREELEALRQRFIAESDACKDGQCPTDPVKTPQVVFVADRSARIDAARTQEAIGATLKALPPQLHVGLVQFGGKGPADCSAEQYGFFTAPARGKLLERVRTLEPGGRAPLAAGLRKAAELLKDQSRDTPRTVVVLTGGGDSCGEDPCAAAAELKQQFPRLQVQVADTTGSSTLSCLGTTPAVAAAPGPPALETTVSKATIDALRGQNCRLTIPTNTKDLSFLEGRWRITNRFFETDGFGRAYSDRPISVEYVFGRDGRGQRRWRRVTGEFCAGKATAGFSREGGLQIRSTAIQCPSGDAFTAETVDCDPGVAGQPAHCIQNDGFADELFLEKVQPTEAKAGTEPDACDLCVALEAATASP
jgi:hypothetical protein